MYCLKCKRDTGTSNVERVVTKNNRNMLRGRCDVCGSKKKRNLSRLTWVKASLIN